MFKEVIVKEQVKDKTGQPNTAAACRRAQRNPNSSDGQPDNL